jgi:hypothetical protein
LPAKLVRGQRQFEKWRRTHRPRARLPETLWSLATGLAREYGLHRTARTLRLDYQQLKKRLALPAGVPISPTSATPPFLELLPAGTLPTLECTIECEDGQGARIRIQLRSRELLDLAALSRGLWSPQR